MNFEKWVKSIQTAGYNGARTLFDIDFHQFYETRKYYFDAFLYLHNEYNFIRFIVSDGNAISKTKEFTTSYKELLQWLCGKTEFYNNEL